MRFLHCSDLHLGKRVHECTMIEEQRQMLDQLVSIAEQKAVDGVLLAGDLFDKAVPSIEAVQLLDGFFTSLSQRHLPVYCISGNHDSPERLSFGGRLLERSGVYLASVFHGEMYHLTLEDGFGPLHLYLLPFVKPSMVRPFFPDENITTYEEAVRSVLSHSALDPSARNVLVAHQFITNNGVEPSRCDSETLSIGGVDQVDASLFDAFDYVALGHLHGPQSIRRETVRYCGSPLKYSFSECRQKKSVTIVELREKGDVTLETVMITPLRELRELRGTLSALLDPDVVALGNPEDYLRVILTDEEPLYDPLSQLRQKYPNILRLDVENSRTAQGSVSATTQQIEEKSPEALFSAFYEMANGVPISPEEQAILETVIRQMGEENG